MVKENKKDDPKWRDQLYSYGFDDNDIDTINEVPLHRFLIKMNMTFSDVLKADIKANIEDTFCSQIKQHYDDIMKGIDRIEKKVDDHSIKINKLQKDVNILKQRNSIKSYIVRGAIYIIIALILFFIILPFIFPWYHEHFTGVFKQKETGVEYWNEYQKQINDFHSSVRGAKSNELTNIPSDTIQGIKGIQKSMIK